MNRQPKEFRGTSSTADISLTNNWPYVQKDDLNYTILKVRQLLRYVLLGIISLVLQKVSIHRGLLDMTFQYS